MAAQPRRFVSAPLAAAPGKQAAPSAALAVSTRGSGASSWVAEFGWPTVLGMFAVGGALLGYIVVKLVWRLRISMKLRTRRGGT